MENNSSWKRDILVIPLIVGIIVAGVTFFLPKLLETGKRISYSIDGPTTYVNPNAPKMEIIIGGIKTTNIFGYKVRLWNSGSAPLTQLAVRFEFETTDTNFAILNVSHQTIPKREFGKIEENGSDTFSKRFVYELLNPKDEDTLTFTTDSSVPLSVFAKAEGLQVKFVETSKQSKLESWLVLINLMLAIVISTLTLFLKNRVDRLRLRLSGAETFSKDISKLLEKIEDEKKNPPK